MKRSVNRVGLALVFALFGFFAVYLNPDGMGGPDLVALFGFGVLAGINLGIYWCERQNPGETEPTSSG